jgi:hypothetical protein
MKARFFGLCSRREVWREKHDAACLRILAVRVQMMEAGQARFSGIERSRAMQRFRFSVRSLMVMPPENPWRMVGYVPLLCPGLYLRIGHAVFCVLVAFLGGEAVRFLAASRSGPARAER